MPSIDPGKFDELLPHAYAWAKEQEEFVLAHGNPLGPTQAWDAHLAGVQDCARIRVMVVDRIPLPEDPTLAEVAKRTGIITEETRCMGFGHALIVRGDAWNDRELLLHNLVHIAQCERSGGLEQWCRHYLADRVHCPQFTMGPLEEEARRIAHKICSADVAA